MNPARAEVLAAIPDKRLRSLLALLLRTPEELQAERQSRQPSPAPQPAGSRKGAIQPSGRTQAAPAVSMHHPEKGERHDQ